MLWTVAWLREVGVGAFLQRMLIAMCELAAHRIVAGLHGIVGFVRTFSAVGVVQEMIAGVVRHGHSRVAFGQLAMTALTYAKSHGGAMDFQKAALLGH